MAIPEAAVSFIHAQIERVRHLMPKKRIVYPEPNDPRVFAGVERLVREGIIDAFMVGAPPAGKQAAPGMTFIDPAQSPQLRKYGQLLWERRRHRAVTLQEAEAMAAKPLHFANLMLAAGDADGCISSAIATTAEAARSALLCIEMKPNSRRLSSAHIMAVQDRSFGHDGLLVFADAAILPDPSATELAELAIATAQTARQILQTEPRVALLSFSTKGSAKHKMADKVVEALRYVKARAPELNVDGELQADAALVPSVGQSKSPGSPVAGRANVLIFPDLDSANIGYKLVERLANGALLAVLFQGLSRTSNIISRGCSVDDVYHTSIVTAAQAAGIAQVAAYR
jgi:phosphate acetyltransferase